MHDWNSRKWLCTINDKGERCLGAGGRRTQSLRLLDLPRNISRDELRIICKAEIAGLMAERPGKTCCRIMGSESRLAS